MELFILINSYSEVRMFYLTTAIFLVLTSLEDISFKIYNRWGAIVYENTSFYDVKAIGWNGKHNNLDQPTGVYIWTLVATDLSGNTISLEKFQKGSILLKR